MKIFRYIVVAWCIALFSCGRSMEQSEKAPAMTDSINQTDSTYAASGFEINFSSDTLSTHQKEVFARRAIQKLEDYYDYVEIISGPKYDTVLRNHAVVLAKDLFFNLENNLLNIDSIRMAQDVPRILIENPSVILFNDSTLIGQIRFQEKRGSDEKQTRYIGFTIKKVNKEFGTEQNLVWETYLMK